MEEINNWAIAVTGCAVAVCIAELLISDTALEKTIRLVLGAFMLCAVLIPLGGAVNDFSPDNLSIGQPPSELPEELDSLRESYLKEQIASLIEKTLSSHDIKPSKISVTIDKDGNNAVTDISAEISLSGADSKKAPKAAGIIKDELGIECRTIISG